MTYQYAWVKVFSIIPEFRILNYADYNSSSGIFTVYL